MDWDVQQREKTRIKKLKYLVINWKLTLTKGTLPEFIQLEREGLETKEYHWNSIQLERGMSENSL